MRVEIDVYEACSLVSGETVRLRVVRETRELEGVGEQTVTLIRDHDSGEDLQETDTPELFRTCGGDLFRLTRRIS